ncbi:MAG: hypothetical protein IJO33_02215 [Bacilli bacterium]|nr:hypothetical protein [Bacilli bacterium]
MSKKYKFAIYIILLLIFISSSVGICYFFYDKNSEKEAIVIKLNNLSINYLDGNKIVTDEETNEVSFSVTNNSNEELYYNIELVDIKNYSEEIKIDFNNYTSNNLNLNLKDQIAAIISKGIKIVPDETHNYKIIIDNPSAIEASFEIKVNEEEVEDVRIAKTIINNNEIKSSSLTKVGEQVAVNAEGLISDLDDSGITYYFRGNVSNNYFSFADKTWRIVRINGDGTVRLILDENIEVLKVFNDKVADYPNTNIAASLKEWYDANLFQYESYIYEGKYCYDSELSTDGRIYTAYNRIFVAQLPAFNCESNIITSKVGLLSLDEALYAGLGTNSANKTNYLYNEKNSDWWTMTSAQLDGENYYPFVIKNDGSISNNTNGNNPKGVRPVINLSFSLKIEGDGTKDNPYRILQ